MAARRSEFPARVLHREAFPENEAVLTHDYGQPPERQVENAFLFEHRIGKRAQYEINVPFAVQNSDDGGWNRGLGDVNVALKCRAVRQLRAASSSAPVAR
jgi:hypothetical protein